MKVKFLDLAKQYRSIKEEIDTAIADVNACMEIYFAIKNAGKPAKE